MTHFTYLIVLLACLVVTAPLEIVLRTRVYARTRRWLLSLLPTFVVFVLWDLYAIHAGQWSYDPAQIVGLVLPGRLPIEEALFFLVVPTCAILTLEAVRRSTGWRVGDESDDGDDDRDDDRDDAWDNGGSGRDDGGRGGDGDDAR